MVSKTTEKIVIEQFGHEYAGDITRELDRYGSLPQHREIERVHNVILRMARKDMAKIPKLVEIAMVDYRDMLVSDEGAHKSGILNKKFYVALMIFGIICAYLFLNLEFFLF